MPLQDNHQQLVNTINRDITLSASEKAFIYNKINDANFYDQLLHGVFGAGTTYAISKFLKLSPTSQVLLSVAGFGIGKYLLDKSRKYDKFIQYNSELGTYDINT